MTDEQRRIAQARLLRRSGLTYDEIRARLGEPVSDDRLQRWLRGIPRPPQTLRGRAKDDLRRECRRLRAEGCTYSEIAARTGASKGSISPWVSDVAISPHARQRHRLRGADARRRAATTLRERSAARRDEMRRRAIAQIGAVTDRDVFVAGVALYWAEGVKDKEWRRSGRAVLINSDPTVLELFLAWLDLLGVPEADRGYRLHIHESADVPRSEQWWSDRLQIPLASFARATLKAHNPKTVRHNRGDDYHGCLVVRVARSGWLYYAIEGWWRAISAAGSTAQMVHTEHAIDPP